MRAASSILRVDGHQKRHKNQDKIERIIFHFNSLQAKVKLRFTLKIVSSTTQCKICKRNSLFGKKVQHLVDISTATDKTYNLPVNQSAMANK